MKKIISLILVLVLALGIFVGCSKPQIEDTDEYRLVCV